MTMIFQELKNEDCVFDLDFCLNYFDYGRSAGRCVSGQRVGGSMVGGFNKTLIYQYLK